MRNNRLLIIGAVLVLAGLVAGANIGQFTTLQRVQIHGAQQKTLDEANNVVNMMPDIGQIVLTGVPSASQDSAIRAFAFHANISGVMLFDRSGQELLSYGERSWTLEPGLVAARNAAVEEVLASGKAQVFAEHIDGSKTLPHLYGSAFVPVLNEAGRIEGVVGVYLDHSEMADLANTEFLRLSILLSVIFAVTIAALFIAYLFMRGRARRSRLQIDYLARYDQLTGLFNRDGFRARLKEMCKKGNIFPARTAVFYFDVDDFKSINDTRGNRTGDDILRHVGDVVRAFAGENDLAGRFGGDEFVIVAQTGTRAKAIRFAEQLQERIAQPVQSGGTSVFTGTCFGIRFGIGTTTDIDEDIHRANLALYQAKLDGRNTCRIFSPELENRVNRRIRIENTVNRGLEDGLFSLQYQPLIHRASGKCVGFEALLRLREVDGELISPSEFVPVAEANGAIRRIGSWVLTAAVAEAVRWPEELTVSVNLSARQFDDEDLVATVRSTLKTYGLEPRRLELEVTESLLIENTDSVGRQLMELRALGISISMDDFGTGYSSLGYLWKYGFDKLKIDRSFILGLDADVDRAREILDTIIILGHRLNMKVIAEGIETETQARLLSELSCDQFQGFLFGRPMSPADLPAFLLKNGMDARAAGIRTELQESLVGNAM